MFQFLFCVAVALVGLSGIGVAVWSIRRTNRAIRERNQQLEQNVAESLERGTSIVGRSSRGR